MLSPMDVGEVREELDALGRDGFAGRYGKMFLVLTEPGHQEDFSEFVNTATRDINEIASGKKLDGVDIRPLQPRDGESEISVGREEADIRIRHQKVSKLHAVFSYSGGLLSVTDAGSKNGTWVNGNPLTKDKPVPIDVGDTINFGS